MFSEPRKYTVPVPIFLKSKSLLNKQVNALKLNVLISFTNGHHQVLKIIIKLF